MGWKYPKNRRAIMRPATIGLILIILGVLAISVHSVTYFSTEHQIGPLGFFAWDVNQPHTIFINPIAGLVALAVGIGLVMMGRRTKVL
jgi:hypothetical protein